MDSIKDGSTGNVAEVDSKNRLRAYATIEDEATFINRVEKEMYSGPGTALKADTAGNYITYLKNTSTTKDLVITTIAHRCEDSNGTFAIHLNALGTPGGTLTELVPNNRNAGSNNEASVEFYQSPEITGLTNGRQVGGIFGKAGEEKELFKPLGGYILPPNATLAIKADNNTATHYGGIAFYFRDME